MLRMKSTSKGLDKGADRDKLYTEQARVTRRPKHGSNINNTKLTNNSKSVNSANSDSSVTITEQKINSETDEDFVKILEATGIKDAPMDPVTEEDFVMILEASDNKEVPKKEPDIEVDQLETFSRESGNETMSSAESNKRTSCSIDALGSSVCVQGSRDADEPSKNKLTDAALGEETQPNEIMRSVQPNVISLDLSDEMTVSYETQRKSEPITQTSRAVSSIPSGCQIIHANHDLRKNLHGIDFFDGINSAAIQKFTKTKTKCSDADIEREEIELTNINDISANGSEVADVLNVDINAVNKIHKPDVAVDDVYENTNKYVSGANIISDDMGQTFSSKGSKCVDTDTNLPILISIKNVTNCCERNGKESVSNCKTYAANPVCTRSSTGKSPLEKTPSASGPSESEPMRRKSILKQTSRYDSEEVVMRSKIPLPFHLNRQTWKVGSETVLLRDDRVSQKLELRRSRVMSRRASLFAKQHPGKPRVRFPDELVFQDNIKENDIPALTNMLRRASLKVDINAINSAGLTPLHQAVLDGNLTAVTVLIEHGSDINVQDEDTWTPLHAACADGQSEIVRYLLDKGADRNILTEEGERPIDLVDPSDLATISIMLASQAGTGQFESSEEEESDEEESDDEEDDDEDEDDDDDDEDNGNRDNNDDDSDDDDDDDDLQYSSFNINKLKKVDGSEIKSSSKGDNSDESDDSDSDDT